MEALLRIVLLFIAAFVVGFFCYGLFIYMPVDMYTEAECLRKGYPKHAVSVGLERYCMNLDGSITVKVDHQ